MFINNTKNIVEVNQLTRYYGESPVVNRVSFDIPKGSVMAFLGRNGAGKTTTMKMILGLIRQDFGTAKVLNHCSNNLPNNIREKIGYLPESQPLYDWMSISNYLSFYKRCYKNWNSILMANLLGEFGIAENKKTGDLSRGQRAAFSLALVLAQSPEIILLDDPTLGLDPVAQNYFMELLLKLVRENNLTVLISSHQLTDMERIADRVTIIEKGIIKVNCCVDTFQENLSQWSLRFDEVPVGLELLPGLVDLKIMDSEVRLTLANINDEIKNQINDLGPSSLVPLPLTFTNAAVSYLKKNLVNKENNKMKEYDNV